MTNASIATSETWKDRQTGEQKERTEWHRVVFRDRGNYRLGQIAGEYLKKGSKVYVEGSLQTRKWQDKSGQDRYTTEIVASEMQMLDSRGMGGDQSEGGTMTPPSQSQPQSQPQPTSARRLIPSMTIFRLAPGPITFAGGHLACSAAGIGYTHRLFPAGVRAAPAAPRTDIGSPWRHPLDPGSTPRNC